MLSVNIVQKVGSIFAAKYFDRQMCVCVDSHGYHVKVCFQASNNDDQKS